MARLETSHQKKPPSDHPDPSPPSPQELVEELQRTREELAKVRHELGTTADALVQARRAAAAASDAKDRFLSSISHELRTPLSAMVLWTSLIEDHKISDPQQLTEALNAIKRSAEEQRALIEQLVDTSRLVAGKLRLDRKNFSLLAAVHNGVEDGRAAATEKRIAVTETIEAEIGTFHGDARRIQQLVTHLVDNAVKFTPPGGEIHVALRRDTSDLVLTVADNGVGLAPEHIEQVFDRFVQVQPTRVRTEGGLGLGLAVSRKIVELHGGTIHAESAGPGRGSTFIVRLPAPPEILPGPTVPDPSAPLAGRHILLIEDAAPTRRALTAVLEQTGASVDAVDSAPAAWQAFERRRPDLIVSDLGLPSIDGLTLIRRIRETEEAARRPLVPAIAVTAFVGEDVSLKAIESGFQTCLTKPIEPVHLVSALTSLASSHLA